jgi:hypothetical protein
MERKYLFLEITKHNDGKKMSKEIDELQNNAISDYLINNFNQILDTGCGHQTLTVKRDYIVFDDENSNQRQIIFVYVKD